MTPAPGDRLGWTRRAMAHVTAKNLRTLVTRPRFAAQRAGRLLHEARHPGDPWLAPGTIELLRNELTPESLVWEFGSGRSTLWFGQRAGRVVSIEHDEQWFQIVIGQVEQRGLQGTVDCRLIPMTAEPGEGLPAYARSIEVEPDGSVDVVLVDGAHRVECVATSLAKIRPGGLLVIDNVDFLADRRWGVPAGWPVAHDQTFYGSITTSWRRP